MSDSKLHPVRRERIEVTNADGERLAVSSSRAICSLLTGVSKKFRMEVRARIASATFKSCSFIQQSQKYVSC